MIDSAKSAKSYSCVDGVMLQISEEEEDERSPADSPQKPKARRGIIIEDDDE